MVPELVSCLDRTVAFVHELVADLSDDEMIVQPQGVPNHAAWTLGHLVFSFQAIACELGDAPWLGGEWESRFGYGTAPEKTASQQLGKDALLAALSDASRRLRTALLAAGEAGLAAPVPDVDARRTFPTTGDAVLQVVAAHAAFHAGQLAAWRRAIGRPPAGVFI